jgi:hypothetical protein
MPQRPSYRLYVDLTEAEMKALQNVLEYPFVGDDSDLAAIVGEHHNSLKTARRMYEKVSNAITRNRHEARGKRT